MAAENEVLPVDDNRETKPVKASTLSDLEIRVKNALDIYFLRDREGLLEAMQKLEREFNKGRD